MKIYHIFLFFMLTNLHTLYLMDADARDAQDVVPGAGNIDYEQSGRQSDAGSSSSYEESSEDAVEGEDGTQDFPFTPLLPSASRESQAAQLLRSGSQQTVTQDHESLRGSKGSPTSGKYVAAKLMRSGSQEDPESPIYSLGRKILAYNPDDAYQGIEYAAAGLVKETKTLLPNLSDKVEQEQLLATLFNASAVVTVISTDPSLNGQLRAIPILSDEERQQLKELVARNKAQRRIKRSSPRPDEQKIYPPKPASPGRTSEGRNFLQEEHKKYMAESGEHKTRPSSKHSSPNKEHASQTQEKGPVLSATNPWRNLYSPRPGAVSPKRIRPGAHSAPQSRSVSQKVSPVKQRGSDSEEDEK